MNKTLKFKLFDGSFMYIHKGNITSITHKKGFGDYPDLIIHTVHGDLDIDLDDKENLKNLKQISTSFNKVKGFINLQLEKCNSIPSKKRKKSNSQKSNSQQSNDSDTDSDYTSVTGIPGV